MQLFSEMFNNREPSEDAIQFMDGVLFSTECTYELWHRIHFIAAMNATPQSTMYLRTVWMGKCSFVL
jgi:hypothetical protein